MRSGAGAYPDHYGESSSLLLSCNFICDRLSRPGSLSIPSPVVFLILTILESNRVSGIPIAIRSAEKWRRVGGRSITTLPPQREPRQSNPPPIRSHQRRRTMEDALGDNASLLAGGKGPKNQLLFPMRQERSRLFSLSLCRSFRMMVLSSSTDRTRHRNPPDGSKPRWESTRGESWWNGAFSLPNGMSPTACILTDGCVRGRPKGNQPVVAQPPINLGGPTNHGRITRSLPSIALQVVEGSL